MNESFCRLCVFVGFVHGKQILIALHVKLDLAVDLVHGNRDLVAAVVHRKLEHVVDLVDGKGDLAVAALDGKLWLAANIPHRLKLEDTEGREEDESRRFNSSSMATKETVAILPEDLLEVALGRLPARSLVAFQCVCKAWRDLPHFFARPPVSDGPLISGELDFIVTRKRFIIGSSYCSSSRYEVLDHCNGLVLFWKRDVDVMYVCNPTTWRWTHLPLRSGELSWDQKSRVLLEPKEPSKKNDVEENDDEDDRRRFMEWPPSPWTWQEFSSATGRWEMKVFVREGDAAGTDGDLLFESVIYGGIEPRWRYAAYWQGQLYVHCHVYSSALLSPIHQTRSWRRGAGGRRPPITASSGPPLPVPRLPRLLILRLCRLALGAPTSLRVPASASIAKSLLQLLACRHGFEAPPNLVVGSGRAPQFCPPEMPTERMASGRAASIAADVCVGWIRPGCHVPFSGDGTANAMPTNEVGLAPWPIKGPPRQTSPRRSSRLKILERGCPSRGTFTLELAFSVTFEARPPGSRETFTLEPAFPSRSRLGKLELAGQARACHAGRIHCATPPPTLRRRHRSNPPGAVDSDLTPHRPVLAVILRSSKETTELQHRTPCSTVTRRHHVSHCHVVSRSWKARFPLASALSSVSTTNTCTRTLPPWSIKGEGKPMQRAEVDTAATRNRCSAPLLDVRHRGRNQDKNSRLSTRHRGNEWLAPQSLAPTAADRQGIPRQGRRGCAIWIADDCRHPERERSRLPQRPARPPDSTAGAQRGKGPDCMAGSGDVSRDRRRGDEGRGASALEEQRCDEEDGAGEHNGGESPGITGEEKTVEGNRDGKEKIVEGNREGKSSGPTCQSIIYLLSLPPFVSLCFIHSSLPTAAVPNLTTRRHPRSKEARDLAGCRCHHCCRVACDLARALLLFRHLPCCSTSHRIRKQAVAYAVLPHHPPPQARKGSKPLLACYCSHGRGWGWEQHVRTASFGAGGRRLRDSTSTRERDGASFALDGAELGRARLVKLRHGPCPIGLVAGESLEFPLLPAQPVARSGPAKLLFSFLLVSLTRGPRLSAPSSFPSCLPAAPVSASLSPLRKARFSAFISAAPTPLVLNPSRSPVAAPSSLGRRFDSSFQAPSSLVEFVAKLRVEVRKSPSSFSLSLSRSLALARARRRNRDAARRREPPRWLNSRFEAPKRISRFPLFLSSQTQRDLEPPSSSFAQLRRSAAAGRRLRRAIQSRLILIQQLRIDPTRVKLKNGPFEGDQDQVYEEEPPQYFEEGNSPRSTSTRGARPPVMAAVERPSSRNSAWPRPRPQAGN
ncbi:hypothetical protein HU200_008069 [Digitaria exilis]|uniref:F-box domain-containing protein n=1 Tax=Digitaria exilis TaxID=1010633 RepID=A0A835FM98_9POAL|nr:hypothetical protein HU200_008069 [Digitaria exilis]